MVRIWNSLRTEGNRRLPAITTMELAFGISGAIVNWQKKLTNLTVLPGHRYRLWSPPQGAASVESVAFLTEICLISRRSETFHGLGMFLVPCL